VWTAQRSWTREQLDREREEYFDTRVTGRQETWSAIRMAVDAMTDDLDTAQTILDAAGITIPTGDLVQGAYDEFGNYYTVPEHCLSDPLNMVATPEPTMSSLKIADDEDEENLDTDEDEAERRREEKGKKVVHAVEMYTVKARLSDRGGPDVQIGLGKDQYVRVLARKVQEEAGVSFPAQVLTIHGAWLADFWKILGRNKVRIAYMGKL
jgi:Ubiquitin-binding domain